MRESFSLFILLKHKDPNNGKRKIWNLNLRATYFGVPVWKMIIKDTWFEVKWRFKKLFN